MKINYVLYNREFSGRLTITLSTKRFQRYGRSYTMYSVHVWYPGYCPFTFSTLMQLRCLLMNSIVKKVLRDKEIF